MRIRAVWMLRSPAPMPTETPPNEHDADPQADTSYEPSALGTSPADALLREMYWAEEATPRGRMSTPDVRDELHDFAALMRADEKLVIPRGEPNLAAVSRWRRQIKLRLFRLMRPISWRYDRLLGDHAELTTTLAERLAAAEAEIGRLRAELVGREDAGGRRSDPGRAHPGERN
jgi:hypothetical protein